MRLKSFIYARVVTTVSFYHLTREGEKLCSDFLDCAYVKNFEFRADEHRYFDTWVSFTISRTNYYFQFKFEEEYSKMAGESSQARQFSHEER